MKWTLYEKIKKEKEKKINYYMNKKKKSNSQKNTSHDQKNDDIFRWVKRPMNENVLKKHSVAIFT